MKADTPLPVGRATIARAASWFALGALVSGSMLAHGATVTTSSEQSGKEILVPGAGGLATGKAPATVPIDVGPKPAPEKAILKLLLAPAEVTPDERYFILVSGRTAAGERRIGAVSFFPPRPGATETFYLDASAFLADMAAHGATRGELVIALAPVSPDQGLTKSSVRVIDARLVDR